MKTLWKETCKIWLFSFKKIPLLFWVRPKILVLTHEQAVIKIDLNRRTKNHLNSMYFGVLCVGADLAGGLHLMKHLKDFKQASFVFKDFHADFLKRPEADVHFTSMAGETILQTINKARLSKERENVPVTIIATTPSLSGDEPVARFTLTLSLKFKSAG